MPKCERCGQKGDYTQIKTCPEKITYWGKKPICKQCYLYLKEVEENKILKKKQKSQIISNKIQKTNFNYKKRFDRKVTDWMIFIILVSGVLFIPMPIFYYGFSERNISFFNVFETLLLINILLSIFMIIVFFKESKKYVNNPKFQTFIFGISLIPFILAIHWVLSLAIPQIAYWYFKKSTWNIN
jgi:hypothetical protein